MPEQQVAGPGEHTHTLEARGLAYVARAAVCRMQPQHVGLGAQAQVIADGSVYRGLRTLPHGDPTNVRCRKGATEIGSPFELIAGFHRRSNISTARNAAGAKMRLLDSVFALCSALDLLSFLRRVVPSAVSDHLGVEKSPLRTFCP